MAISGAGPAYFRMAWAITAGGLVDSKKAHTPSRRVGSRLLIAAAALLILLDAARLVVLPPSYQQAFMDGFETVVVLLCALACGFAAVRSSPIGRGLWLMTAAFFGLMAAADFHDFLLDVSFGPGSLISTLSFLGWCSYPLLAFLIFFPAEKEGRPDWNWISLLDFLQVTLAAGLAYFQLIYLPRFLAGQTWMVIGHPELLRNLLIAGGLLLRSRVDTSSRARAIYLRVGGVFASVVFLRAVFPGYFNPIYAVSRPGLWLLLGILAVRWQDLPGLRPDQDGRRGALRLFLSLCAAATLLVVVVLALSAPAPYRKLMYFCVGVSVALYILRTMMAERSRYAAETKLRRSEHDYRVLFESAVVPIVIFDPESERILQANAAACELYGVAPGGLVGARMKDFTKDIARSEEQVADLLRTGTCQRFESVHQRRDGKEIEILVSSSVIQYGGRKAILSFNRDITERKRAEQALIRLRRAVDASGEVIFMTDREGIITSINPEFTRLYGYTPDEVVGKTTPRILKSGNMSADDYKRFWNAIQEKRVVRGTIVNRAKDGHLISVESSVNPIQDEPGEIIGFLAIQRDVTGRKQLERQFLQAQKMEAVGRLAGGVAHDFNNLLTVINGYTDLMLEGGAPGSSARSHLEEIRRAGDRASALTRQLLAFSRRQVVMPVVLDLNAIVEGMHKMLRRLIREDIEFHTSFAPDLGGVKADAGQIEQVIMNLAVNARDAMPKGGKLIIETANVELDDEYVRAHPDVTPGRYVLLALSDTGWGMDVETQSHIFEPFFTTKHAGKGTGLGLSTVYGIVKQSGGHVNVYSEAGQGTVFKVYLPRIDEPVEAVTGASTQAAELTGSETVLLAEDEPSVRSLAAEAMRGNGYAVLEAGDAEQALALWAQHSEKIDLLLSDVVMPGMNGKELADRLKQLRPELKVLFISGYTADAIAQHGILEEGVVLLSKPFTPRDLLAKLRQILRS